jgi:addiction module RelE/StbE family toxin
MTFKVRATPAFQDALKTHQRNRSLLDAMDKKLDRLRADPYHVGKPLSGQLHGQRATRLRKNFRLLFTIDDQHLIVLLEALDHRKDVYD